MRTNSTSRLRKDHDLLSKFSVPLGIDLSAWIGGASFLLGAGLVGPHGFVTHPWRSALLALSYGVFLAFTVLVQRDMRVAASATSFGTPQQLATTGVFAVTRNPIYLAFLLPLACLAMFSLLASLAAIAFYVLAMNATVIPREEQDLRFLFGNSYVDYTSRVRRWI